MSVLCGTDFSTKAKEAAGVAAALAERLNAPLVLLHSVEAFADTETPGEKTLRQEGKELLGREAERLRNLPAVLVQKRATEDEESSPAPHRVILEKVAVGPPDEALVDYALQPDVSLVVVGSLGRREASRWPLGSVAERTAQTCRVPVVVIRDAEPWRAWLRGERPLRIVVGADSSTTSDTALQWVAELARMAPCDVTAVHVAWPPEERERLGLSGPIDLAKLDPRIEEVLLRDLTGRVAVHLGNRQPALRVLASFGRAGDRLLRAAEDERADLVVAGTHQRHSFSRLWHGSVSRELLHDASMSVACVPLPSSEPRRTQTVPVVKQVLAATDLSELGNRAVSHAYSVLPEGGVVHLIHVVTSAMSEETKPGSLEELIPENAIARRIETRTKVIVASDVAGAIRAQAERLGVDLVCVGSHGRTGLTRVLLGSVAEEVLRHSARPVLIIHYPPQ